MKGKRGGKSGRSTEGAEGKARPKPRQRTLSSQLWLRRQQRDPFVAAARRKGYLSRAAFKLLDLDDRFHFFKPGRRVVDLGAAPGGWTQVAVERCGGGVLSVDLGRLPSIEGSTGLEVDLLRPDAPETVKAALGGRAEIVLSDMAPAATGHRETDHMRSVALVDAALRVAAATLVSGGTFVAKLLQGGDEGEVMESLKGLFSSVKRAKPPASRPDSAEVFIVATGFRGAPAP